MAPGGTVIELGPYVLQEPVAQGGMAEVWRGVHAATDTPLAVKISSIDDPTFVNALHGEASVLASFRTPYLVAVHDFGRIGADVVRKSHGRLTEGAPWLAMEWLPHGTIEKADLVTDWRTLRRVLLDVLFGLAHAHARGIVHRDVKPENVLVASHGPLRVKLADFGIAFARDQWLSGGAKPLRALTPRYAAPEQVRGQVAAQGPWTDLYLLGCVARFLATGAPPFADRTRAEDLMDAQLRAEFPPLAPTFEVPDGFGDWLARLTQKAPGDRFRSAPHASDALLALERLTRQHRRHWSVEADPDHPPPRGTNDPGPGVFANRRAPLVGRDAERDRLWNLLYDVSIDRRPRSVRVHGPSGVGTTALAQWFTERVAELGLATVCTAVVGTDSASLRGLVARALGGSLHRLAELPVVLAVHVRPDDPDAEWLTAWLLGTARLERTRQFALTARALVRSEQPVVVWIEGAPDGDLLAFVRWVTDTRAFPALFVFTEADERAVAPPKTLSALAPEDLPLAPLPPHLSLRLVSSFGALEPATAVRIADRAAGSPGLAVELLRALAAAGDLKPSDAGWRVSRSHPLPVPTGPLAAASARVDEVLSLVPRALPALSVAAALGTDGTVAEWEPVCRRAKILVPPTLSATLLRLRLLVPRAGSFAFAHPAFVDAVAERTRERQPALHALCAEHLVATGGDDLRIGRHLIGAGRPEEARERLQKALLGKSDIVREGICLDLLDRLIPVDAIDRAPLLFRRIERARIAGRIDAAFEAVRTLLALAKRHQDGLATARALMQRAVLRVEGGDDEGAVRDATEADELVTRLGPVDPFTQQAPEWCALVVARTGHVTAARARLEGRRTYLAHYALGLIALEEARLSDALAEFGEARTCLSSDLLNDGLLLAAMADAHRELGRIDTAAELANQALSRLLDLETSYVGDARVSLGLAYLAQSRIPQAEAVFRGALADNEDARRAAIAGLAIATARQGRDPNPWLALFDPQGLRMSVFTDRVLARGLEAIAALPHLTPDARVVARQRAAAVLARCVLS